MNDFIPRCGEMWLGTWNTYSTVCMFWINRSLVRITSNSPISIPSSEAAIIEAKVFSTAGGALIVSRKDFPKPRWPASKFIQLARQYSMKLFLTKEPRTMKIC
uniref:Uncharacterized protein n=1 Tax=Glossina austeni TaxID=7395 RepID=A0A1A9UVC6_GLOAU